MTDRTDLQRRVMDELGWEPRHDFRTVLFDHVGAGRSDLTTYDAAKYSTLQGYATDVLEICEALELEDVVFVGHSVSAMIGMLASLEQPDRFSRLVMVGPSPRYIDDDDYIGGFSRQDIESLLASLDRNYLGWSRQMAPVIMGNPERLAYLTGRGLTEHTITAYEIGWDQDYDDGGIEMSQSSAELELDVHMDECDDSHEH